MSLTERLKYLLIQEDIKQKELAKRMNTSAQTVNNWLKRDSISREAAQQISEIYGYSLDWLLNGVEPPKLGDRPKYIPENETAVYLTPKQKELLDIYDSLPDEEAERFLREMKAKKAHFDAIFAEMLAKRGSKAG
ncbi:helix-turn-helix domain-containing protein [Photorhabdus sp. RM71S]|uniref:helix-turn-helix domain-containing protein n=1 Tax=Photorhabdus sp. RM71S TaxID=3342824 RepID=UPI0036DE738E